ncbi:hypothetical protein [Mesorhizobium sp. NZP2077]|uniref:hypothetical protein n=1 Tax=Mesorhizobium sp. NZP2077 TaxID=2483404 RepID=UPI00155361F8|nr:hypothetical protein [Mesorhizobium sp. NZP2077]QKC84596.1 hypothetical protein EB232_26085 [Mesorhizobium sp. NZP2077]QKD18176.1 hypothetical protein HGP13_25790 [Mesorhizobium sp. NZP2077]
MMNKSAMGAFRPSKNIVSVVAIVAMISAIAGCQGMDATETNSVSIKPVVHPIRSKPAALPVYAMSTVHSLRIEPRILMTSAAQTTESDYAFASPQPAKVRTPGPVKVAFNPGEDGPLLGGSPYICSPSGFGQRASCHPRYL